MYARYCHSQRRDKPKGIFHVRDPGRSDFLIRRRWGSLRLYERTASRRRQGSSVAIPGLEEPYYRKGKRKGNESGRWSKTWWRNRRYPREFGCQSNVRGLRASKAICKNKAFDWIVCTVVTSQPGKKETFMLHHKHIIT